MILALLCRLEALLLNNHQLLHILSTWTKGWLVGMLIRIENSDREICFQLLSPLLTATQPKVVKP